MLRQMRVCCRSGGVRRVSPARRTSSCGGRGGALSSRKTNAALAFLIAMNMAAAASLSAAAHAAPLFSP